MSPNEYDEQRQSEMYPDESSTPEEKPKSAVVFGVLSIVFGSWGLLGLVMSVIMLLVGPRGEIQRELQLPPHIQVPMLSIGFGLSLFLLDYGHQAAEGYPGREKSLPGVLCHHNHIQPDCDSRQHVAHVFQNACINGWAGLRSSTDNHDAGDDSKYGCWIAVFNWLSSGGADILHPAGRRKEVRSV